MKKWSIVNTAPDHSEPEILKFNKSERMKKIFFSIFELIKTVWINCLNATTIYGHSLPASL